MIFTTYASNSHNISSTKIYFLDIGNSMVSSAISFWEKTCTVSFSEFEGRVRFGVFKKLTNVRFFKLHEKPYYYLLIIIYMKKLCSHVHKSIHSFWMLSLSFCIISAGNYCILLAMQIIYADAWSTFVHIPFRVNPHFGVLISVVSFRLLRSKMLCANSELP